MKLNKNIFVIFGFVFGVIFTSCVSVKKLPDLNPIYVTNMKQINLLPTAALASDIDTMMQLNGQFGDQNFTVLVYVQADDTVIYMSLMNDFGTEMGELVYDGASVAFDSALFPPELPTEYIINDFQNAFYKPEEITANLNASKLKFEVEKIENGEIRRVLDGKKIIEEITIKDDTVQVKNLLRGYKFDLVISE